MEIRFSIHNPQSAIRSLQFTMRLGIFGGSFDPIHIGHLTLAQCCLEGVSLDEVWFVPAATQPFKPIGPRASDADRCRMIELAIQDQPCFRLCMMEIERGGTSYTVDTLRRVRDSQPGAELFLLLGADAAGDLPSWREPDEILRLAEPVIANRSGLPAPAPDFRHSYVAIPNINVSSTEVRHRASAEQCIDGMVPAAVAEFIRRRRLYR
jgi:nicotinate-nucleotide adenylyltransferase